VLVSSNTKKTKEIFLAMLSVITTVKCRTTKEICQNAELTTQKFDKHQYKPVITALIALDCQLSRKTIIYIATKISTIANTQMSNF